MSDKVIWKDCTIDLTIQLIENLNAQSQTIIDMDKLLNKNWGNINISKDEKKSLQKGLLSHIKAAKTISKSCINSLDQIKYT